MRLKASLALLGVSVLWGSAFAFQRIIGKQGGVYFFNGFRFLLGSLFLIPFIWKNIRISWEQCKWMGMAGAVLFVASAFQQAGMQYTSAGNAGFLTSLSVVIVPFVLLVGWRETLGWPAIFAISMAMIGAYLLSAAGRLVVQSGDAMELAGALFWSLHLVILGKFAVRYPPIQFAVGQFTVAGTLNLLAGLVLEQPIISSAFTIAVVYTALFSVALGYTIQVWAQRYASPSDAALLLSMEAVFAVLTGWLFLSETLNLVQVVGSVLIFSSVVMIQLVGMNSE